MEKSQEFIIKPKKHKIPFTSVNEIRSIFTYVIGNKVKYSIIPSYTRVIAHLTDQPSDGGTPISK